MNELLIYGGVSFAFAAGWAFRAYTTQRSDEGYWEAIAERKEKLAKHRNTRLAHGTLATGCEKHRQGTASMTFVPQHNGSSSSSADGRLAGGDSNIAPAFFVAGVQAVTIERRRRKSNEWGLMPLLVERKTFKAIYIPFSHNNKE